MTQSIVLAVLCCLAFAAAQPANDTNGTSPNWGSTGHEITAMVAKGFMSSGATAMCKRLLPEVGGDIAMIASWADDVRRLNQYLWSGPLHFINTPDWSCNYNRARDCKANMCTDGAIGNYTKRMQTAGLGIKQQAEALKFLVHFIGDIHQPLHVGFTTDRGGNSITGTYNGASKNLHVVWDSGVLDQRLKTDFQGSGAAYGRWIVQQLNGPWSSKATQWRQCSSSGPACSQDWAVESAAIACSNSYVDVDGKTALKNGFKLATPYYTRNMPVVEQQLAKAGIRLANVLNSAAVEFFSTMPQEQQPSTA
jgi:hypothetical protein